MKIPIEVSTFFAEVAPLLDRVEEIAIPVLSKIAKRHNGFFRYRVKSAESLTAKLQKGEIKQPLYECNDIFAGTIVVPSRTNFPHVEAEINEKFSVREVIRNRLKKPTHFDYDDVHFIISLKPENFETEALLHKLQLELQLKTLLQYAIAESTHDVLYKGSKQTSRQIRLAAQLRALLEMAEGLMNRLELADEILDFEEDKVLELRTEIGEFIKETWDSIDLPSDMRRTAITIEKYLSLANITFHDFTAKIAKNEQYFQMLSLRSVEPVTAILAVLIKISGQNLINRAKKRKIFFIIPSEAEELLPALSKIPPELRVDFSLSNCAESVSSGNFVPNVSDLKTTSKIPIPKLAEQKR
ncbi:MAG: RelA/SpoT domain-containing protein [Thiomargarita sp.]|nr:RelA/SpoT domain-containing protein [Thiomargarita sp.]